MAVIARDTESKDLLLSNFPHGVRQMFGNEFRGNQEIVFAYKKCIQ